MSIFRWELRPVYVQTLVYADEVVLIADTERDLQVSVTEWASTFSKRGLGSKYKQKQSYENLQGK